MYQWRKGIASWEIGKTLYISVPFTWMMDEANKMASLHKGPSMIGGPGTMTPTECPGIEPILSHNPLATFTTRGCPNRCSFCAVPKLEGEFREIKKFRPAPVVCDNNLLASSRKHLTLVVDALKQYPLVDFNQGLDARLFTPEIADMLGGLKCRVRFAFDHISSESKVKDAIDLCLARTTKDIGVYVLFGFNDTPDDAIYRMEKIKEWGLWPNPMRYQPLDAKTKNSYISPNWTEQKLRDVHRYYSRQAWLEHIPFSEYEGKEIQMEMPK